MVILAVGLLAAPAAARPEAAAKPPRVKGVPRLIFPVVGDYAYTNDYGAPRSHGGHQGNDILAPWRVPVVAVEAGTVKFHTTSWRAGCMLYLYGESGTTYLYIHLNNDLTPKRDNRGSCVPGTAYWPGLKDGQRVAAGQPIGYNGDSGDAEGTYHLHFEVHPNDGGDVNPFPYLNSAQRLLFAAQFGSTVTLVLKGTFLSTSPGYLKIRATGVSIFPTTAVTKLARPLVLTVPPHALVQRLTPNGLAGGSMTLAEARKGQQISVLTAPLVNSLDVQLARDGTLSASQILIKT